MCPPDTDDDACDTCVKESCCSEVIACQANADCKCMSDCTAEGGDLYQCGQDCGLDGMNAEFMALGACSLQNCADQCL